MNVKSSISKIAARVRQYEKALADGDARRIAVRLDDVKAAIQQAATVAELAHPVREDNGGTIAARLRAALDSREWTAYRLACESGVQQSAISKILSGERLDPQWSTVQKLADALGVTTDSLR